MGASVRPRIRLNRKQYEDLKAEGYNDEEIGAEYDLPSANTLARTATGLLGKAVQGISLGTADELAGGLLAPWGKGETLKEKYQYTRGLVNRLLSDAEDNAPVASKVAEFGGAVAPALVGAGTLIPRAAGTGWRALAARGAANVAEGAATAGAAAFGNASGSASERMAAVPKAMLVGGAAGGVLPAAVGGVSGVARRAYGRLTARGATRLADDLIGGAIENSGRSADDITRAIQDPVVADKPLTLIDRLGTPGRKLARGAKTTSAGAATTLDDLSARRMPTAGARVLDDVRAGFGIPGTTPTRATAASAAERAAIGQREFTAARMGLPVESETLHETLLASPVYDDVFGAMSDAARLRPRNAADAAERRLAPLFADAVDAEGNVVGRQLTRTPTIRDVEAIRKGIDDALNAGRMTRRDPFTGRRMTTHLADEERAALQAARDQLMGDEGMNAAHDWYAPARDALAEWHQYERAIPEGSGMAARDPADITDAMAALPSEHARRGARVGFAANLGGKITDGANVSASDLAGGGIGPTARAGRMARLRAMAPDDASYARMAQRLNAEGEIAESQRFLSGQSNTADKHAERDNLGAAVLGFMRNPVDAAANLSMGFLNPMIRDNAGRTADEIARRFATMSPLEQAVIIAQAREAMARAARRRAAGAAAGRAGGAMGGAAVSDRQR